MTANNNPHHFQIKYNESVKLENKIFTEIPCSFGWKGRIGFFVISFDFVGLHHDHFYIYWIYSGIIHQKGLHLAL
jgi:hypothetical protein